MHLLDDGSVAVTGRLADQGYGLLVADPATGAVRTTVLLARAGRRPVVHRTVRRCRRRRTGCTSS